jgi:hypothetical protein
MSDEQCVIAEVALVDDHSAMHVIRFSLGVISEH